MNAQMELRRVRTYARPLRRAILVRPTKNLNKLLDIFGYLSTVWGGYYTILIPTDGKSVDSAWLTQLRDFDPDRIAVGPGLRTISKTVEHSVLKSSSPFKDILDEDIKTFPGAFLPYEIHMKNVLVGKSQDWIVSPRLKRLPPLANVYFLSRFGYIDEEFSEELGHAAILDTRGNGRQIEIRESVFGSSRGDIGDLLDLDYELTGRLASGLNRIFEIPSFPSQKKLNGVSFDEVIPRLPMTLTRFGLKEFRFTHFLRFDKPIVCVVGSKFEDYVLAHNLERLGYVSYWVPFDSPDLKGSSTALRSIGAALAYNYCWKVRRDHIASRDTRVISTSLTEDRVGDFIPWLAELASRFDRIIFENEASTEEERQLILGRERQAVRDEFLEKLTPFPFSDLEPSPIVPVFEDCESLETIQFLNSRSLSFPEPKFSSFVESIRSGHLGRIAVADIENYKLPMRYEMSRRGEESVDMGFENLRTSSRVSRLGISFSWPPYYQHPLRGEPKIRLMDSDMVFQRIFKPAGYTLVTSDKGRYFRHALSKAGPLNRIAEVLSDRNMNVLQKVFLPHRFGEEENEVKCIELGQRYYLPVNEAFNCLSDDDGDVESFIVKLLENSFLQQGFLLKCSTCLQLDWYPTNEVTQDFICHRCTSGQSAMPSSDPLATHGGPNLYYRLNEAIYQFLDSGCDVTARSLSELQTDMRSEMLYLAESQLVPLNSDKPFIEIDFVASWRGALTIGECRKNWKPKGADRKGMKAKLKKYKDVFQRLRPDVMAICSLEPLTKNQFISGFQDLARRYNVELIAVLPEEEEESDRIDFL